MKKPVVKVILSEEFIVTAVLFLTFLGLTLYALGWPGKPRIFPLWISILALVLLAGQIVSIVRIKATKAVKPISWKVIASFLSLGVAIFLAYVINLAPAIGILGAALAFIFGERRWWAITLVGIVSFSIMYFIFGKIVGMPMKF